MLVIDPVTELKRTGIARRISAQASLELSHLLQEKQSENSSRKGLRSSNIQGVVLHHDALLLS